jgi:hypothetical protein
MRNCKGLSCLIRTNNIFQVSVQPPRLVTTLRRGNVYLLRRIEYRRSNAGALERGDERLRLDVYFAAVVEK